MNNDRFKFRVWDNKNKLYDNGDQFIRERGCSGQPRRIYEGFAKELKVVGSIHEEVKNELL